jgi:hypothetical protein
VVALAAGCSGSNDAGTEPAATSATASLPTEAPEVGEVLERFVAAAGNRDVETMWALLSEASREELGPTVEDFAAEYAEGFQSGLGSFAGSGYQVVLAEETESGWGVAAVAGERERSGEKEYAAYAAAFSNDGSGWRIELGAPLAVRVDSPPAVTSDRAPPIRVAVEGDAPIEEAGVWLDGEPLPATPGGQAGELTITGEPRALSPGRHVVVVFGRSGERAVAGAFPFTVEGVEADVA